MDPGSSLDLALRRHLVTANVAQATNTRHKSPTRRIPRAWSAEELATFLTAARPQRLYPELHLAAYTGMRRSEVAGLKWSDVDRANQRLSVTRTLQSLAGQPVEFPVKTRTSRRCIDLDDQTMAVLVRVLGPIAVEVDGAPTPMTGCSSTPRVGS